MSVRFPVGLDPVAALAALESFSGLAFGVEVVTELAAGGDGVAHYLWVPAAVRSSAESMLRGAVPSVRIGEAPQADTASATCSLRFFIPTPALLHSDNAAAASRTLLAGLTDLRPDEQVVLRWALRAGGPRRLPAREPESRTAKDIDRAWRRKTAQPGMRVAGLLVVRSSSRGRARMLAAHVESVIRSRRGLAGGPRVTTGRGSRRLAAMPRTTRTSGWLSAAELLGLVGWPIGPDVPAGVDVGAARELLVPRTVARRGRRLLVGRDASGERPVAIDATAARHHVAVVGPSGVGKSVLLAGGILSDIAAGYGGVVIDPKADLIQSVLERVAAEHADRIVVLDPGEDRPIPGLAMLSGGDPDTRADVLTGALRAIFADVWGVRSDYYARLAIRTLAEVPGATLADMGRLFFEPAFRRAAIARLNDPFLVSSWQSYEALSEAAQAEHVQAPMNRVMALLARPRVRAVLANPAPKLDIRRLLAEHRWLMVSLAPGVIGEAAAQLIGTAVMYAIWSAVEARVALPPERRHPLFLHVDELSSLTAGTPFGFELLAERARGLGMGLTVALQTLGRVPEPARSVLLGNVASLITFRASAEEAPRIARQLPGLSAEDVMALGRFEVAARVGTGAGSSVVVVTGRTEPLPPITGQAEAIRDASAERYGSVLEPTSTTDAPVSSGGEPAMGRAGRQA
ncbi:MAG TPA: hypothetical protein VES65_10495 [Solirubrobacteraceae bacterium]|nr:hypothetical protein [Solirubrobacteraceae bacterium]